MRDPFRDQVAQLPGQFEHTPSVDTGTLPGEGRILIGGMGGSGLAGEFLGLGLAGARETLIVRDEFLPERIRDDDFLLAVSYSGNTSETLSLWREAGKRNLPRAAVASGGALLDQARTGGLPHGAVPTGLAPRSALGYLIRAGWALVGAKSDPDWGEVAGHLRRMTGSWIDTEKSPSPAQELASRLEGTMPVFLAADPRFIAAARRWVANLAENAKVPAAVWELPEAAHNRIMTVARDAPRQLPVSLFGLGTPAGEAARTRWETTQEVLESHGTKPFLIDEPHPDPWIQALGIAHLGDWVSVFLAEILGVDASQLSLMDDLKRLLAGKEEA
jgi:glucose/mannose-6-phosphate isomerase